MCIYIHKACAFTHKMCAYVPRTQCLCNRTQYTYVSPHTKYTHNFRVYLHSQQSLLTNIRVNPHTMCVFLPHTQCMRIFTQYACVSPRTTYYTHNTRVYLYQQHKYPCVSTCTMRVYSHNTCASISHKHTARDLHALCVCTSTYHVQIHAHTAKSLCNHRIESPVLSPHMFLIFFG